MRTAFLVLLVLLLATPATAQYRTNTSWISAQILSPVEEASDRFDAGFGLTVSTRWVRTARFDWLLETGYYHLPGEDRDVGDIDDLNTLAVLFGGMLDYGVLQVGMKGGYYYLNLHEWDGVPVAQVTVWRLAIGAEYKAFGTNKWGAGFVKYRW